ncbi:YihA family ribosome biogenesis GTP-binding protein [Nitrosomonas sp. JL21]|uniref:ribosome biogenesis GTP-binding protein YihA/YsxC n=1 Tax=Nitrosomonas sp. JL21 TaxID=153949 RepID=UPI00136EE722|nr:ribosome biogenesis GTP-binding protein YihA/YsxC [Nitrosomonas sp. JL21]MBL8498272.1 YihA family ribosome biogenesis GTP-binding protein [Nitrosomonas sp.]MCC7091874.1 YihA family ribosome biogenesis GTP-binding protein [Nitrosomonas sp.]MXS77696.1 YihA family ribosome biogenesis GTP-binding protein [Nitrosomonas sp. JL21]
MSQLHNATFFTSVNHLNDLPKHAGIEIAFAGRSNAGKSSAINTLSNRNRLAFVSKTPGRTQQINFFKLKAENFLVDLPGYGYANVPYSIRQHWQNLLSKYLQTRQSLKGMVLIMDIRHPLQVLDVQMLDWFSPTGKAVHILLTKADKLSKQRAQNTLKEVSLFVNNTYPQCSIQLFSSLNATGVDEASTLINQWFERQ